MEWSLPANKRQVMALRLLLAACLGLCLALSGGKIFPRSAAIAQDLRVEEVEAIVYQRLPYLPKENQYIRLETQAVDAQFSLVNRIIRFHTDVKKRSPGSRLDWKLTLADYLGINEPMQAEQYPGNSTMAANPMEGDREAIRRLNRRQRAELVDLLASLYTPPPETAGTGSPSQPQPPKPAPAATPAKPALSKPGDAQLLLP
jgi:hypothetical protein